MKVIGHIPQEDLALYAMQLLDAKEQAEMQRHIAECAECSGSLAQIAGDLAAFALTAEMHSPPAQARERLMKQISREKKVIALKPVPSEGAQSEASLGSYSRQSRPSAPQKRGVIVSFVPYLGWAAAAAMLIVTISENSQRVSLQNTLEQRNGQVAALTAKADHAQQVLDMLSDDTAMHVSLTKAGAAHAPIGRATYLPEKGALLFMASNMEPLPPFKTYELWVIPADGRAPVPAGTFIPDLKGDASIVLPDIPKNVPAKAFGITIEDQGGSQTPTMPIVMSGS